MTHDSSSFTRAAADAARASGTTITLTGFARYNEQLAAGRFRLGNGLTIVLLPDERALLTGDMVLGRGTTVVAHPDGALAPYFTSIERMRSLVTSGEVSALWPAHGPVHDDGGPVLDYYLTHRRERLAQVRAALAELGETPTPDAAEDETLTRRVVEVVYRDVDESLWGAAEWSVRAQLAYLAQE